MESVRRRLKEILVKAAELRDSFGDEARAKTLEWAAGEIERVMQLAEDEVVSLREASRLSGYSVEHLARLVREEKVPTSRANGSHGRIVLRRGDVPIKPAFRYIRDAELHDLASSLFEGGKGRDASSEVLG
jgi:predicted HTH domain antitoxin